MEAPSRPQHREEQLRLLSSFLGTEEEEQSLPECLLVQGLEGTGKTSSLRWLLHSSSLPHAVVHCVEVYHPRLVLQACLDQVADCLGREVPGRCDTVSDFLAELPRLVGTGRAVLVLEGAERLREEGSLLQVFTRLRELCGANVCAVLETRLEWGSLRPSQDIASPLRVHFQQYNREQLAGLVASLLAPEQAPDYGLVFRRGYATLVLSVFYTVTRSLGELVHIARLNYGAYCRPVVEGECQQSESKKLWFNIEADLKKCLSTVHLREVASRQLTQSLKDSETEPEVSLTSGPVIAHPSRLSVELPFYSKFLLIAAFLASYNPAKSDKRFFQKHHGKQRKTSSSIRAKERMNSQLTGPKTFPLERLLAIFYNIVDEKVNPTASIYCQLTSLTQLQLLTAVGQDMMDQPKYKCNVSLDFIRTVAKPLQFDVYKYLYDHC